MTTSPPEFTAVYVYLRFSSDGQADGNSFDRQREKAHKALAAMSLPSNMPVHWIEDPGLSAFKGTHLQSGELGKFLRGIQAGEIRDGLFMCESVSRASRQGSLTLLTMLNVMLEAGFWVKVMDTTELFNKRTMPPFLGTQLSIYADLAFEESRIKSDYSKANWQKRRNAARETKAPLTGECPNWLRVVDGKYEVIEERAASIREIYALAKDGWGISRLVGYANDNKLPAPGKQETWHLSLIKRVLTNRAVIGEFQPQRYEGRKRVPDGEPILDYYPVIVDPDLFHTVQGLRAKTMKFPTRRDGNNYNYLMGLAKCECGSAWRRMNKNSGAQAGYALYGCANRQRRTEKCENMNARVFDFTFIWNACNRIPETLATGEEPHSERRRSLESQLEEVAKREGALLDFIETNPGLGAKASERYRALVAERARLQEQLGDILREAPPPAGFSFDHAVEAFAPAFLDVYPEGTPEWENAYRARSLFRTRIIESVASATVASDRSWIRLKLKNGSLLEFDLTDEGGLGAATEPEQDPDTANQRDVAAARAKGLSRIRRVVNPTKRGGTKSDAGSES